MILRTVSESSMIITSLLMLLSSFSLHTTFHLPLTAIDSVRNTSPVTMLPHIFALFNTFDIKKCLRFSIYVWCIPLATLYLAAQVTTDVPFLCRRRRQGRKKEATTPRALDRGLRPPALPAGHLLFRTV